MPSKIETLGTVKLYKYYLIKFEKDVQVLEDKINLLLKQIDYKIVQLKRFKNIAVFDNYNIEDFAKKSITFYINKHGDFYKEPNEKMFITILKELRFIKVTIGNEKSNLKKLLANKVNLQEFKFIIDETNRVMVTEIIENGDSYLISGDLGYFAVAKRPNIAGTKVINHGATRKLKAKLLSEKVELKTEATPDGKKYNVYFTDDYFFRMKWFRISKFLYTETINEYRFFYTKGENHVMKKLYKFIRGNPDKILIYQHK